MPHILVLNGAAAPAPAIAIAGAALSSQADDSAPLARVRFGRLPLAMADGWPLGSIDPAATSGDALLSARYEVDTDVLALLRGIDQLLQWNVDVISLSLGPAQLVLAPDHPLARAVQFAWDSGVVVVVAAGNWGPEPDTLQALARLPHVIAGYSQQVDEARAWSKAFWHRASTLSALDEPIRRAAQASVKVVSDK